MSLQSKINLFYKRHDTFRKPLEKIINLMLDKCRYTNGESLERHNWGEFPKKLSEIPKDIHSITFESDLMKALELNEHEKSIIELLWGDIQLGKRIQACVIMWISVRIIKRPVLYIFRNLNVDKKQLQDDIVGTDDSNFNIQFIKNIFDEFDSEFKEEYGTDVWKDFNLPELKDITNKELEKLSNKKAINPTDIFCCLMNHTQLEKINEELSKYISYNDELINMTVLVDESDLMSPTASNDKSNKRDEKDSTKCEKQLAKIYKKVKYALHITGTAHSLLSNITTHLDDEISIRNKISKVHKMVRTDDYFGLFNNSINFETSIIQQWWNFNKKKYNIEEDYDNNIKNIIQNICERKNVKYNSLLISEEKIKIKQDKLVYKILNDYPDLFIILYNGEFLRVYLSKEQEQNILDLSKIDSEQSKKTRLLGKGGIYGRSKNTNEKSELLPNNYCYFEISSSYSLKSIYKLLRMLFDRNPDINKTVVTITGKYGERGYSFTSDDYGDNSFHLTDQYFVSHSSLDCTDISQRLRLQGKYNDPELKNGEMKLTLWTTPEVQNLMQVFFINFVKAIERNIMKCNNWEDIKTEFENLLSSDKLDFVKYLKYIDVLKKCKNLVLKRYYDKKYKACKLPVDDLKNDEEIKQWCRERSFPEFSCINTIKTCSFDKYYNENVVYCSGVPISVLIDVNVKNLWFVGEKTRDEIEKIMITKFQKLDGYTLDRIIRIKKGDTKDRYVGMENAIENNLKYTYSTFKTPLSYNIVIYDKYDNIHITMSTYEEKMPDIKKNVKSRYYYHIVDDDLINYSELMCEKKKIPNKYYFKAPEGGIYLYDSYYDKGTPKISSIEIRTPE